MWKFILSKRHFKKLSYVFYFMKKYCLVKLYYLKVYNIWISLKIVNLPLLNGLQITNPNTWKKVKKPKKKKKKKTQKKFKKKTPPPPPPPPPFLPSSWTTSSWIEYQLRLEDYLNKKIIPTLLLLLVWQSTPSVWNFSEYHLLTCLQKERKAFWTFSFIGLITWFD